MCRSKDDELQDLRQNVLPDKDNTIAELQAQTVSLIGKNGLQTYDRMYYRTKTTR